jgi:phosphate-selective porin OprO/OprP
MTMFQRAVPAHPVRLMFGAACLLAGPGLAAPLRIVPVLKLDDQPTPVAPLPRYALPDLAPDAPLLPEFATRVATVRPGVELILDWTHIRQEATSIAQVGVQPGRLEVRSAAVELAGELGPTRAIGYKIGVDYNGFDVGPDRTWTISDFNVSFAVPAWRTKVSVGQMREDFGYEVVASTNLLPQSERQISPFVSPINFGAKVTHVLGRSNEMTLTYGIFSDDWGDGDGKPALSVRFTRLMLDDPDRRRLLHLGVGVRRAGSNGTLRYRGRPGVAAADDYVDTGEFPARASTHLAAEAQFVQGPLLVLGEYIHAAVNASETSNPGFDGYYMLSSWMLTGETRDYDRTRGVMRRVVPRGRWGALELMARYAAVDLNGGTVQGGHYNRIEIGLNWWATTRWKAGILWGHVWLNRFGDIGQTESLLTRIQWIY